MFPCDRCGLCCRHIKRDKMPNENGVCKYLDENTNLCKIYENRPVICRVDDYYERYCKDTMTREEFYAVNLENCKMIKSYCEKV